MLDIPPVVPAYLSSDVCTGALACVLLIINMADISKISLVPRLQGLVYIERFLGLVPEF